MALVGHGPGSAVDPRRLPLAATADGVALSMLRVAARPFSFPGIPAISLAGW